MRNFYLYIAVAAAIFAAPLRAPAAGPETQPSGGGSPQTQPSEKEQDIRRLLEVSGSAKLADQVFQQMIGQFRQSFPGVPPEFWGQMQAEVNMNELMDLIVPVYDRHFSDDDIKGLIHFYESPLGQKMVGQMPQVVAESMGAGQQWGRSVAQRVMDRLKQKGYLKT